MAAFRLLALLFVASVFAGCAWSQPPADSQAMFQPYRISGVTETSTLGNLMLTKSGLWAFVEGRSAERAPEFFEGELVAFVPHRADAPSHLFGVVVARSWGVMMQRLDSQKVAIDDVGGELVPLGSDAQLRRWGICRGDNADLASNACLQKAHPDRAWRIYRADSNIRLEVASEWALSPPIRTDGVIHGGRTVVRGRAVEQGWIAVPTPSVSPHPAHARVLIEPDCPELDLSQSLQPVEVSTGEASFGAHPVEIEAAAVAAGADVLVRCTDTSLTVAAPTLYRPILAIEGTSARGLPFGAMRPITLSNEADSARGGASQVAAAQQSIVFLAAALSTGSVLAADFYLEQAILVAPDDALARRLAVEFMQVPPAAGRPEVALRSGLEASRGAWHRQNRASFVLGQAWVLAGLGQVRAHAEAMSRVQRLAQPSRGEAAEGEDQNEAMRLWLVWSQFRDGLGASSNRGKNAALSFYEQHDLPKWLEAARLLAGWSESQTQSLADTTTGIHQIFAPAPHSCTEAEDCKLDVYGRNLASFVEAIGADHPGRLVEELNTLGVAALRPGFRLSALASNKPDGAWRAAVRAAAMPLLAPQARSRGFEKLSAEVAQAWRSEGRCLEIDGADQIVRRIERFRRQESAQEGDAALAATTWLLSTGLPAACESAGAFVASLEGGLGHHPELAAHAGPLFEALASKASDDERSMLLDQFAAFTAAHEKGSVCKRWNLALAVSRANAGQLSDAETDLSRAINCQARDGHAYSDTEQLLIAYLRFEKSASIADDISADVRERLSALVRQASGASQLGAGQTESSPMCLGLLPLEYRLERFVHPDVAALAVAMPKMPRDDLALETSSTTVSRGKASLVVARRYLSQARPTEAARALVDAREAFNRIDHQVGLRRVAFLEAVIFDGDLQAFSNSERSKAKSTIDLGRPASLSATQWAGALRAGKAHQILEITRNGTLSGTDESLYAALAASMLVQAEEQSVELWRYGSGRASFDVLCR